MLRIEESGIQSETVALHPEAGPPSWRRLGDAWVATGGEAAVWLVRDAEVLLAGREYALRLAPGTIWIDDPREPLRARAAGGQGASLLRLPLPNPCPALLTMLHDAHSEAAVALHRLAATQGAALSPDAVATVLERAQASESARIERCSGRTAARRREQYIRLARARSVLAWGDGEPADIARLAEIARLSTAHFVRLFHRVFEVPPHRYRIERRMQLAYRMIADTPLPIGEILQQIGLGSHSTFTRSFRRHFGVSATMLRAQVAG